MPLTRRLSKYVYVSSPAPAPTEEDFVWEDPSSDSPNWPAIMRLLARVGILIWAGLFCGGLIAFVWFALQEPK